MAETRSLDALRRAASLADGGDLPAAARLLATSGLRHDAAALVDARILGLSARHDHDGVVAAAEAVPPGERLLATRICVLDAQVGAGQAQTGPLQSLIEESRAAHRDDLAAFASSVLVDHLLLHGDPGAVFLALGFLAELPTDPLPPPLVLVARARLRRAVAVARLLLGPAALPEAEADYRASVSDYNRAGWQVDRWLTVAAFSTMKTSVSWSCTTDDQQTVAEARDQLLALGSPQAAWARFGIALTSLVRGDVVTLQTEVDHLVAIDGTRLGFLAVLAQHLDALVPLLLLRPGPAVDAAVRRLGSVADEVRRQYPVIMGTVLVQGTHGLADAGRPVEAAAWLGRVQALGTLMPHESFEREVLACRIALLAAPTRSEPHDRGIGDRLEAALAGLLEMGQVGMARALALRSAMTARTVGADALADRLLAWTTTQIEIPKDPTWWELRWEEQARSSGPAPGSPAAGSSGRGTRGNTNRLRLLTPTAELTVDGAPVRLAPATARVVGVLAALDRPTSTENLVELLWPGLDPRAGRGRLKSAHHRLRQALAASAEELVHRDGDVWSIAAEPHWSVDLRLFRSLAAGSPQERLAALRLPEGLLWQVEFPYDEALAEQRAPLEVLWLQLADELVRAGAVTRAQADQQAARLGLDG